MATQERRCVECSSPDFYARDRCQTCYGRLRRRQRREGSFELLLTHGAPLERLRSRTEVSPNGCLLYAGTLTRMGYGLISVDGTQKLAHRAIYELVIGPIPEGLFIDHTCHNRDQSCMGGPTCLHRRCVNVDHLEPVSGAENTRRGKSWAINGAKTHCPAGHPYDEHNTHVYDGRRYCRACNRQTLRRRRAAS
ncbi:HNH endonuclease [Streptomyces sp. BR123]|uniref:HNH endonuclease signature motif containing protein n=1 Tax=Streptomyces sp. BR123 TaxID=2749828 RepID=UPI0015C4B869|nr:HNH endonuclease signature motif containing protein [Streptomyces sp. BR123]NXY96413.1 HNH endonuclease [Streptomyces sp. BR123]